VLFNPAAVAEVVAESEAANQRAAAEVQRAVQVGRAHCDKTLADAAALHRGQTAVAAARLTSEKSQSAAYKKQLAAQKRKPGWLAVTLSAVGGALVGLATGIAVAR
jgi:hypothetical protein